MRRGPTIFLVLAAAVTIVALLMVRHQLGAAVFALALGFLLRPLYAWLHRKLRWRGVAGGVVLLLVALVLIAPFVLVTLALMDDAVRLVSTLESRQDVRSEVEGVLSDFGLPEAQVEQFSARIIDEGASYLQRQFIPIATIAVEFLLAMVVFFILLYYVLVDGPRLTAWLERVMPAPPADIHRMLERMGDRVKGIMMGTFAVSVIQGVLAGLGWWLLGLPAPVFWGVVMLILSVVPVIGAFIVLIPAAIWSFAQGDIVAGVGLLVLNFVMVGLIDDVLRPYLIGKRSGVHPAFILLGIVGGIAFFGISGIILGPLLMGMLAPLYEVWAEAGPPGAQSAGAKPT